MSLPKLDKTPGKDNKLPSMPSMPSLPDEFHDDFVAVDVEEALDETDDYNEEVYEAVEEIEYEHELPSTDDASYEDSYQEYDDYNPDYEEDLKKGKKKKFIDKKNKKIIPFGGRKSRRKVKSSEMDDRKNALAKTKIIRFFILAGLLIMFIVGVKNTFLPKHIYTPEDIKNFAKESVGDTNFPNQRGEAFVKDFMELYLTMDRERPELKQMLAYYYGENMFAELSPEKLNIKIGPNTKQHIILGPTVYGIEPLTDYSTLYKVSAYVSDTDGTDVIGNNTNGRWVSFAVNVYYDENVDGLAITKDSPSIIPTPHIAKQVDIPERMPFGNGTINADIGPALNPTINGFVEAYAKSSVHSHESILQYISDKNDINLYNGFGGTVELNGAPDAAIKKVIYNGDDDIYRVDLTVDWIDKVASSGDNQVQYTARYVMRVIPEGKGKYSVSSFVPYTYYKQ